jgi:hypothetical protein
MATLRTWKEAFFNDKVCCPHQRCTNKAAFFNEAGLEQHLFILQGSVLLPEMRLDWSINRVPTSGGVPRQKQSQTCAEGTVTYL